MNNKRITTLDQCTANAQCVKELRQPEAIRQQLASARADILNDVDEFFQIDHASGIVESLLTPFGYLISLCDEIQKAGTESKVYDQLPTFSMLNDNFLILTEAIRLVVRMGEDMDYINRMQELLCVQQEAEGHTIIND